MLDHPMPRHRLSKSRFIAGLQCHKLLWLKTHEYDAPELIPDAATQAIFDNGNRVGELAREHVPGGQLIEFDYRDPDAAVKDTASALEQGARLIYEATFREQGVLVAVDILEQQANGSWTVIEVKSTTGFRDKHLPDLAVQVQVVRQAGLDVQGAELMHLNKECRFPDLSDLFTRTDAMDRVRAYLPRVTPEVNDQLQMLAGEMPEIEIGPHCKKPHHCPFKSRCWAAEGEHSVQSLYKGGKRSWKLREAGVRTLADIPADEDLSRIQQRQVQAVRHGRIEVAPGLGGALSAFKSPLAFLDFETIAPAVPRWEGCGPYHQMPVQFVVYREGDAFEAPTADFLPQGPGDPRRQLAEELLKATEGAATVLAYNKSFEQGCITQLAEAFPDLAQELRGLRGRIADLLPPIRNHVYHPDFHGSFSIKAVLPALLPDLTYQGLVIAEGSTASSALQKLLLEPETLAEGEGEKIRAELRAYCRLDVWAMVKLLERLRDLG